MNRTRALKVALVSLLLVAVTGCRSAGTTFYTLLAPPPSGSAQNPSAPYQLDVLPVDVPPEVDRVQMVVRQSTGQVTPVDTRSWIAPLSSELQRALSNALVRDLGARDIDGLATDAKLPTVRVKMSVRRFESVLGQYAEIEAQWTVSDASRSVKLLCGGQAREAARPGYEGLAEAHQRVIAQLADQIGAAVRSVDTQGEAATCPVSRNVAAAR